MGIPTPSSKSRPNQTAVRPRAHIVFWRAFPNGEMCPTDPEGKHLFIYNLELPGTGATTMGYYMSKGYRPIEINLNMPANRKGPIIEAIEAQLVQVIPDNQIKYKKAQAEFKPEMMTSIRDEIENERRANMNAMLRHQAAEVRKKTMQKEGRGKGTTVAEEAGIV